MTDAAGPVRVAGRVFNPHTRTKENTVTSVQITPSDGGGYTAVVNGIALPIDSYAAEPGPGGRLMVSLAVHADSLQIGVPPARRPDLDSTRRIDTARNEPPLSTWGDPTAPDPRRNVPGWTTETGGWKPPPAGADAGRGRTGEYPPVSHRRQS
jgi:hypothetical protein